METQYKIIGGDGREYGPATLEELIEWIRDGRVAGTTQTWREDLAAWLPASAYEEFAEVLAGQSAEPVRVPPAMVAEASVPVGFWARLAAYLVDVIALTFLFSAVWEAVIYFTGWQMPVLPKRDASIDYAAYLQTLAVYLENVMPKLIPYFLVGKLVHLVYDVLLNGHYGATLGKMAIGARIVRTDGSAIGYKTALLRWLAARVSDFLFYTGYLFIAFREDKRALHDLMTGTKVIYRR